MHPTRQTEQITHFLLHNHPSVLRFNDSSYFTVTVDSNTALFCNQQMLIKKYHQCTAPTFPFSPRAQWPFPTSVSVASATLFLQKQHFPPICLYAWSNNFSNETITHRSTSAASLTVSRLALPWFAHPSKLSVGVVISLRESSTYMKDTHASASSAISSTSLHFPSPTPSSLYPVYSRFTPATSAGVI